MPRPCLPDWARCGDNPQTQTHKIKDACPEKNTRVLKKITYLNEGRGSPHSVAAAKRCV